MSQRASPTLIGLFVMGAAALLVLALLVWGSGRFTGNWETLVLYFRSSTSGLTVGAPVVLKGVQIGTVKRIQVAYDEERKSFLVPVYIEIDQDQVAWPGEVGERLANDETYRAALRQGLRARLGLQSLLTGLLQVEIGFFPGTELVLVGQDPQRRELPTIPSELERLREEVLDIPIAYIVSQLTATLEGLNRLANAPEAMGTLTSLEEAARELALAAAEARALIRPAGEGLGDTLGEVRALIERLGPKLDGLIERLAEVSGRIGELAAQADAALGPLAGTLQDAGASARSAFSSAERAFDEAAVTLDARSPLQAEARGALQSVSAAARSLRLLADYLQRHPEALIQGKR